MSPPHPDEGCIRRSALGLEEARRLSPGSAGNSSHVPQDPAPRLRPRSARRSKFGHNFPPLSASGIAE